MKGHIKDRGAPPAHSRRSRASVGIRELKAHAARILREVRETRASYLVTHRGRAVGVILPLGSEGEALSPAEADDAAAWESFLEAGRRLERRFEAGAGGVRLLSDKRR
jgi:prevent-host-death family protein